MATRSKFVKVQVTANTKVGVMNGYTVVGDWLATEGRMMLLERPESAATPRKPRAVKKAAAMPAHAAIAVAAAADRPSTAFPPPGVKEA